MVWLQIFSDDGTTVERVELRPADPKRPIRVAVGEPGRHSLVWRVWANRNQADVYIAARTFTGYQKFSLHASGDWRHQWVTDERAAEFGDGRIMDQWRRPADRDHGHTTGVSIWVAHGNLDTYPDEDVEDVAFIPEPPEGNFAGIHITVSTPDRPAIGLRDKAIIGGFTLAPNEHHPTNPGVVEAVLGIASVRPVTDKDEQVIISALHQMEAYLQADGTSIEELKRQHAEEDGGLRVALFGQNDEGIRHVHDLAVSRVSVQRNEE